MTRPHSSRLAPVVVLLVTVAAFLPTIRNGWVSWDDDKNFLDNPAFRGLGADQLRWMWSTFHLGHYVPLSWMSLGVDYSLWGMTPGGYHATSLLLHSLSAVLVYFIARRLIVAALPSVDSDADWAALFGALLWAVHPLRVESVAWITERRDVLSGLFYFAALLTYLRSRSGERSWYAISPIAFVAALLSKGTAVTLPAALFIVNVYPLRRLGGSTGWRSESARRVYGELAPYAVLAIAFAALTFIALRPVDQLEPLSKLAVSAYSLWFYLIKMLAPVGLSPLYEMPLTVDVMAPRYLACIAASAALITALWRTAPRWPALTAAACAFGALIFPLLGVHQNGPQIAADRYTYLASAALAILAGLLTLVVSPQRRTAARGLLTLIVAVLATLTWQQLNVWQDGEALWNQVVRVEPRSAIGNNNVGNVLMQRGALEDARAHYAVAVASNPRYADAHINLGVAFAKMDSADAAIAHFRLALETNPDLPSAHMNWGVVLAGRRDVEGAVSHYRNALAIDSTREDAHVNWGNALLLSGRASDAVVHYQRALALQPDDVAAHLNWGVALAQQGQLREAISQWQAVLAIDPNQPDARTYLEQATRDLSARAPRH